MENDFDLSFDSDFDEFDPFEDADADEQYSEEDEGGEYTAALVSAANVANSEEETSSPAADERSADERIAALFKSMAPHRKVLLGILAYCTEPAPVSSVNDEVDRLKKNNRSVYTAANLCTLLENAGAIKRVTSDGQDAEETDNEPEVVVVDGIEYLEAKEPEQICWVDTEAGLAAYEADKPLERLHELLDSDAKYAVIYKRILSLCAAEGGASTPSINEAVDNDPLVQKPRLYAPHFVDRLEKCDALEWRGIWCTTEIGLQGIELLADVADETAIDEAAANEVANEETSAS